MNKLILSNIDIAELSESITEKVLTALKELEQISGDPVAEDPPQWLKPKAAAEIIGYRKDFIYKLVKDQKINAYYPGADLVVKKSELLEYMEKRKVAKLELIKRK